MISTQKPIYMEMFKQALWQPEVGHEKDIKEYVKKITESESWPLHLGKMIFMIDYTSYRFAYFSPNVESILGFSSNYVTNSDLSTFIPKMTNPLDLHVLVQELYPTMKQVLSELKSDELKKAQVRYNYRIRNKEGKCFHAIQESVGIFFDKNHDVLLDFNVLSITGSASSEAGPAIELTISTLDMDNTYCPYYSRVFPEKKSHVKAPTQREKEILTLVSNGKTSKEISEILHISEHTVNTHRRKMIRKFSVSSTFELVAKANALKWI